MRRTRNGKPKVASRSVRVLAPPEKYRPGWLAELDGRVGLTREIRARFDALTDDLGGLDALSYQQRSLCERCLWLEFWLSEQERELASGGEFDAGRWTQGLNSLTGVFRVLGLRRVARELTLADYIRAPNAEGLEGDSNGFSPDSPAEGAP